MTIMSTTFKTVAYTLTIYKYINVCQPNQPLTSLLYAEDPDKCIIKVHKLTAAEV